MEYYLGSKKGDSVIFNTTSKLGDYTMLKQLDTEDKYHILLHIKLLKTDLNIENGMIDRVEGEGWLGGGWGHWLKFSNIGRKKLS